MLQGSDQQYCNHTRQTHTHYLSRLVGLVQWLWRSIELVAWGEEERRPTLWLDNAIRRQVAMIIHLGTNHSAHGQLPSPKPGIVFTPRLPALACSSSP